MDCFALSDSKRDTVFSPNGSRNRKSQSCHDLRQIISVATGARFPHNCCQPLAPPQALSMGVYKLRSFGGRAGIPATDSNPPAAPVPAHANPSVPDATLYNNNALLGVTCPGIGFGLAIHRSARPADALRTPGRLSSCKWCRRIAQCSLQIFLRSHNKLKRTPLAFVVNRPEPHPAADYGASRLPPRTRRALVTLRGVSVNRGGHLPTM